MPTDFANDRIYFLSSPFRAPVSPEVSLMIQSWSDDVYLRKLSLPLKALPLVGIYHANYKQKLLLSVSFCFFVSLPPHTHTRTHSAVVKMDSLTPLLMDLCDNCHKPPTWFLFPLSSLKSLVWLEIKEQSLQSKLLRV